MYIVTVCISDTESRKLKFSMQTYLTHNYKNYGLFEYCHASVILDNVDVLYIEDVCRPLLKNDSTTMFFSKKSFLV